MWRCARALTESAREMRLRQVGNYGKFAHIERAGNVPANVLANAAQRTGGNPPRGSARLGKAMFSSNDCRLMA